ncbi:MAG: hypothetical protein HQ589_08440 [Syntrophaceae bacterium]|nr:hypothetical protein [Syntrophaceae bacterium]
MQYAVKANKCTQPLWIIAELQKCLCGTLEQEFVYKRLVVEAQGKYRMGQGED